MKKIVEELASKAGVDHRYSGSTRVMYLRGEKAAEFKAWIKEKYPTLAFELKLDEGLGLRFEHGELVSVHGDRIHPLVYTAAKAKRLAEAPVVKGTRIQGHKKLLGEEITDGSVEAFNAAAPVFDPNNVTPLIVGTPGEFDGPKQGEDIFSGPRRSALIQLDKFPFNELPATREQVDEYLLSHPIDRNAKNPYNEAAKALNQKTDYIRGRWRSLRERGLVEKENA